MSLTLHAHPLSSFCMKAIIPLYENDTPFKLHLVDLGDAESAAGFKKIWPIGKFPVLVDDAKDRTIPESSIIIEYLDRHYPGKTRFIPADPDLAQPGCGSPTVSMTCISITTCRRSSAIGCARPTRETLTASKTPRSG